LILLGGLVGLLIANYGNSVMFQLPCNVVAVYSLYYLQKIVDYKSFPNRETLLLSGTNFNIKIH